MSSPEKTPLLPVSASSGGPSYPKTTAHDCEDVDVVYITATFLVYLVLLFIFFTTYWSDDDGVAWIALYLVIPISLLGYVWAVCTFLYLEHMRRSECAGTPLNLIR